MNNLQLMIYSLLKVISSYRKLNAIYQLAGLAIKVFYVYRILSI